MMLDYLDFNWFNYVAPVLVGSIEPLALLKCQRDHGSAGVPTTFSKSFR